MFTYPGFDPIVIQLGPLGIRWYGLMYLVGIVGGWWFARKRINANGPVKTLAQVDDLIFYLALGVILGGRLGYMLFYDTAQIIDDPLRIVMIWKGGMSFHGGLLGVTVAMALYARKSGCSLLALADFVAPLVPIGLGAGRIGNFINGALWGKATDLPWAVIVNGQPRHASQLYEAFLEGLVLFTILWVYSARPRPTMAVTGLFLLCYGLFRFLIEFVRLPDADIGYLALGWVTLGQVLTLPMILGGMGMMFLAYRRPIGGVSQPDGASQGGQ